jgi:L-histidine N-alpha-methyltransferase
MKVVQSKAREKNMPQVQNSARSAPFSDMLADVREGLARPQKELSPKYFYDQAGSLLFEEITRLPEYYLTSVERGLLLQCTQWFVTSTGCKALIELGAGSASKTQILLDGMLRAGTGCTYVPIDLNAAFLAETTGILRIRYPDLRIMPVHADITRDFRIPKHDGPSLFALLGSTIGNFDEINATRLLRRVRGQMEPDDCFLLGVDLRKGTRELEAAYNDVQGVTARFNLNILQVLNRELGADFDLTAFTHRAFYDEHLHRIEMHLVSGRVQAVTIPDIGRITLSEGETIRTEISCKYDRAAVEVLFEAAGLEIDEWHTDEHQRFALVLGRTMS